MTIAEIPTALLAKSRSSGRELSLERHLLETEAAATQIFSLNTRVGLNFWKSFRVVDPDNCLLNLQIAALFHDIGKCSESFYSAVTYADRSGQAIRHEHLSSLILNLPEIIGWLKMNQSVNLDLVTAAVLSHHLKADESSFCQPSAGSEPRKRIPLFLDHPEINRIFQRISEIASLPDVPILCYSHLDLTQKSWDFAHGEVVDRARQLIRKLRTTHALGNEIAAVKAALILSDSVSSATFRNDACLFDWIEENIHSPDLTAEQLEVDILSPRAAQIQRHRGSFGYHNFQELICRRGDRVLLRAGCGAGKTLAAYRWAKERLRHHRAGRLIFLYPTRGTATEGFRDYAGWAPEGAAELLHGKSQYELGSILSNPPDSLRDKDLSLLEDTDRWFSLRSFKRRYFSATVDQFLGFVEHSYSAMCTLPILTDSIVVIDEVHSFDDHLFRNLLSFLDRMDVPVLCMTATLQSERMRSFEQASRKIEFYPSELELAELEDLSVAEMHPRYSVDQSDEAGCLSFVKEAVASGQNVLWVVNTVARCQRIAQTLSAMLAAPEKVLVYHSRFRLKDRQEKHQDCVRTFAFGSGEKGVVAVTTQVCEMSLDLDADCLVTEIAPIESLIQRLGRVNRHYRQRTGTGTVMIYPAPDGKPYDKEDLVAAGRFVSDLCANRAAGISQSVLASKMLKFSPLRKQPDPQGRIFDSGLYAVPGNLREIEDLCTEAIRVDDFDEYKRLFAIGESTDGLVLPVPNSFKDFLEPEPWLPKHLKVVPSGSYSEQLGFIS